MIDSSGSMKGRPKKLALEMANIIIASLISSDRVAVVELQASATVIGCNTTALVHATDRNKDVLRYQVAHFQARDRANFALGVDTAFDLLDAGWADSGQNPNRSQVIIAAVLFCRLSYDLRWLSVLWVGRCGLGCRV